MTAPDPHGPPRNIEAEQALLGALLCENELYHRVSDFLRAEHFHDPLHGAIYRRTAELIEAGTLADALTLRGHFESEPGMAAVGGVVYLARLMAEAPDGASAHEYARVIYDLAIRRALIEFAGQVAHDARAGLDAAPAIKVLEGAEAALAMLADTGVRDARTSTYAAASAWVMRDITTPDDQHRVETGLPHLDKMIRPSMRPGKKIVIAGRPGQGKSVIAAWIQLAAARDGWYTPMFNFEMDADEIAERALSALIAMGAGERAGLRPAEFPTYEDIARWRSDLEDRPTPGQQRALELARKELEGLPADIINATGMTPHQVRSYAQRLYREADKRGLRRGPLITDYLQLMDTDAGKSANANEIVSRASKANKDTARQLGVPFVELSQLSRKVEERDDKRPLMSDLRDSGAIEQDADCIIMLYRDAYYAAQAGEPVKRERDTAEDHQEKLMEWHRACESRVLELIIRKQRGGRTGTVKVLADVARNHIEHREVWFSGVAG